MFIFIIISSVVLQLIIALFVLVSTKKTANKLFAVLSLFLVLWSLLNYFITKNPFSDNQLALYRLLMASVVLQNTLFLFFAISFPNGTIKIKNKQLIIYIFLSLVAFLVALSPMLFTKVNYGDRGARPVAGPGMLVFVLHSGTSVFFGLRSLYRKLQKSKSNEKNQLQLLLYGSIILWGVVPITNFVITNATETLFFSKISPIYTFTFSTIIAYAIVRHKVFDIRAVATKAVAYFLMLAVIALTYVVSVNIISSIFTPTQGLTISQIVVNIILTALIIVFYPFLKLEFDKLTNKIFYRDAYDAQVFLDELNKSLINNVELDSLLTKTALIFQEQLKASFCTFYIRKTSYFDDRIIGAHRSRSEYTKIDEIQDISAKIHKTVFSSETETDDGDEMKLTDLLKQNGIELMAKLTNNIEYEIKGIGYIFIGPKKSGSLYSHKDIKLIEIITNELVIAIENVLRFEEIEQFNVTLQKKIDDATKELKESNDKLKALDEAKDEFVSMASHQLRTPLTSIKGYISMVLEGDAGKISETQAKMLGQAFFSSQRMVYLISDLLNVSRLKTGKFIIESKPVYLPDIVESEIEQLIEGANSKNLTLSFTKPKEFPTMLLDEMKLRQVIMNFTDNAIYYTPSGGKITVALKETPKSVEFTVKDNGIGVPKDQQHKLFVKFYRADNARKARPDGTGLGLFMAKKVIIAQGGSIIFISSENNGSTFGFSFPKEKLKVDEPELEPDQEKKED
jgi:signal transduction histidine kinase